MEPATTRDQKERGGPDAGRGAPGAETPVHRVARVWATLALAALAGLAFWSQALAAALIYDRALLSQGQWWRAWSGHVVHFGGNHLFWDIVVFLPVGCWLESLWPGPARWFYLWCPLVVSAVLYAFDPVLLRYAGLSGLATGVVVLFAGLELRSAKDGRRWLWVAVLALVGAKLGHELVSGAPLLVTNFGDKVRSVPLAHLSGAVCGVLGCLVGGIRTVR